MVVQHNLTAMNSNRMLGVTTGSQAKSTEKLSSGFKINRAADDAAGLSISEKMRKQIRGLTQASLNAEDGISAVQTAEGALNEVQDMLQRANELAVKAANGTMSENDRSYIQNEIDQLTKEIDRVAETTKFNETYLLKGDKDAAKEYTFGYKVPEVTFASGVTALYTADGTELDEEAAAEYLQGNTGATLYTGEAGAGTLATEDDYDFTAGTAATGITAKVTFYVGQTTYAAGDDVSALAGTTNSFAAGVTAYKAAATQTGSLGTGNDLSTLTGTVLVRNTADGTVTSVSGTNASNFFEVNAGTNTQADLKFGFEIVETVTATNALDASGGGAAWATADTYALKAGVTLYQADGSTIANATALASAVSAGTTLYTKAPAAAADADDYTFTAPTSDGALYDKDGNWISENALSNYFETTDGTTITQKADTKLYDADGNEVTLSATDITNILDAPEEIVGALTLKLHVGADATANNQISIDLHAMSAKGLGVDGLKVDGADDKNALQAIETIKEAIQKISTQRSALGAVQNRLEHTIANLDNVVENTTAAESQIRDTDMATEMVKYSNNNILAQAGTSMLAQANQANQNVLSLLG